MLKDRIMISGFSDEIDSDFERQLKTVTELGMNYISLRSAYDKNISAYSMEEINDSLLPLLKSYQVKVSSIGSPIGKLDIRDNEGYVKQLVQLESLCNIAMQLQCKYIRIFSFYIPEGENPDEYHSEVIKKIKGFVEIANKYQRILIHENEKDIYGDIAKRCDKIVREINHPCFKLVFDFANFVQCGENTVDCWNRLKDQVVYIHIKDALYNNSENVICGTGDGNILDLLRQILNEGYSGFLTLEPHLVMFDQLSELENRNAAEVIKTNKAKDGAEAYKIQYNALMGMLSQIA